ncbi:hypothetical protein [Polyangium jinanense]|uniref:Cytochrome c domain-containing protein n=1 Tax=Polyangium jinanense TaxID=2829994 RepID=A0A9X4AX92_9BACT|nr:hypothetical protein [Polyangium jinanense]MDC3961732.1 hypothetical protein [Polyangium jinanense]MDC3988238.1 hypothetical protein [Polyangium jinanense]
MRWNTLAAVLFTATLAAASSCERSEPEPVDEAQQPVCSKEDPVVEDARVAINNGRQTFRFDTFGDEAFWGGQLRLHETIRNLTPVQALGLGLKVDVEALPKPLQLKIKKGQVDLNSAATTLALLRLNAVVGVTGFFDGKDTLVSVGIQCALCHSTVDDSFSAGIGKRQDGWPNRDLNVGAIIASAPTVAPLADLIGLTEAELRTVLVNWGVGKFDAELILDGKTENATGGSAATLIPAAFGLAGVNLHTYTGWGSVTHWNAFVANLEMGGQGIFFDPRLDDADKFPIAAANDFDDVRDPVDRITPKLADLHFYQLALEAPKPPANTFQPAAAKRGKDVFNDPQRGDCARCHVPPIFTEPGWNMHTPAEIGIDAFQSNRSPDERYRTTPLGGLFTRKKGGFYHDGRFANLGEVVDHYESVFNLNLSPGDRADLIEYLKSL